LELHAEVLSQKAHVKSSLEGFDEARTKTGSLLSGNLPIKQ